MIKAIFRLLMLGLGLFTTYTFGRDTVAPLWYRVAGVAAEGRISGFLAGRNSPSIQREPTGVRKGKLRARRPVFTYPTAPGALDSLEARSSTGGFLVFGHFELNDRVTVVYSKKDPSDAHLFAFQLILTAFLVTLLGLYMIRIGITGRLD